MEAFKEQRLKDEVAKGLRAAAELAAKKPAATPASQGQGDGSAMVVEDGPPSLAKIGARFDKPGEMELCIINDVFLEVWADFVKTHCENIALNLFREAEQKRAIEEALPLTNVIKPSVSSSGNSAFAAPLGQKEQARQLSIEKADSAKKPGGHAWGSKWKPGRGWLERRIVKGQSQDGQPAKEHWGLFCTQCEKNHRHNSFTRPGGCTTLKLDSITRHEQGEDHRSAANAAVEAAGFKSAITRQIVFLVNIPT